MLGPFTSLSQSPLKSATSTQGNNVNHQYSGKPLGMKRNPDTGTLGQDPLRSISIREMKVKKAVSGGGPALARRLPGTSASRAAVRLRLRIHAKNKIAGRIITVLVLGLWDKNTGICTGAMPNRRDFPTTTRI